MDTDKPDQESTDESTEDLMIEIRGRIEALESSLPKRVDALISPSRLPFKALIYRAALIWRMAELSRGAFENFEKDRLALALLDTRAAVETAAALWYLYGKLKAVVAAGDPGDIDTHLMRLVMGTRDDPELPAPINVLTFVDRVEKDAEGFRHQYDILSEFSHPNWAGTALLYSRHDQANLWTDFGANIRGVGEEKSIGAANLSVALMFFEHCYNRIADILPQFVELCNARLKPEGPEADASNGEEIP
jgi:hypothetical protein